MQNYFRLNYLAFFIISLFPLFLISGPFLSDLFCVILGILFIKYIIKNDKYSELLNIYRYYIYFFLGYLFYLNINSLFSFDLKISFVSSITYIRIFLFIFALGFFLSIYKKTYKIFYVVFFVSAFFLFIDSTIQYFFNLNIFTREEIHVNRISSFFGEELIMGSYISRILPIALACSFLSNFKNRNLLNIAMLIISGFLVMYSGERVAAFYYIGTCVVYFSITKKDILKFIIAIFFSILLITTFKTSVVERFYKDTISQFNQTGSILSYRHLLHLKTAYDLYLDKKLLGHGLKSFRHKCSEEKYEKLIQIKQFSDSKKELDKEENSQYIFEYPNGCNTHPHNIYLEHLSELGLIGVIFLVLIFLYAFINLVKNSLICIFNKDTNSIYIAKSMILSGVVLQLFPIIPSGSFFNNWMMIIFNLSIGFYLSTLKIR